MGWLNVLWFTLPFNNSQGFEPQAGHISNMTSLFFYIKKNNKDFTIINKYKPNNKNIFGTVIASLLEYENIKIFEKDYKIIKNI